MYPYMKKEKKLTSINMESTCSKIESTCSKLELNAKKRGGKKEKGEAATGH